MDQMLGEAMMEEYVDETLLTQIDFSEIDTFDPNLEGGFKEYFAI